MCRSAGYGTYCRDGLVNTARHPGVRKRTFCWRQIVIWVASGMKSLHNLNTSGVHALRFSCSPGKSPRPVERTRVSAELQCSTNPTGGPPSWCTWPISILQSFAEFAAMRLVERSSDVLLHDFPSGEAPVRCRSLRIYVLSPEPCPFHLRLKRCGRITIRQPRSFSVRGNARRLPR